MGQRIGRARIDGDAQAPFAERPGGVAGVFEQPGEGGHRRIERRHAVLVAVAPAVDAAGVLAGHQVGPRRGTDRITRVMIGKPYPLGRQAVDVGRLQLLLAVTAEVPVAQVVGQDVDHVGWGGKGSGRGAQRGEADQAE